MMKHLSVLGDPSCNAFRFIYKALYRRRRYGYCIDAPHIDVTDEQKSYLEKRLNKVDRLIKRPIYCRVPLDKEKNDFVTEINLSVPGDTIFVKALSNDQTKSIVDAVDKLVSRVVKFKETRFSKI